MLVGVKSSDIVNCNLGRRYSYVGNRCMGKMYIYMGRRYSCMDRRYSCMCRRYS